jgi:AAHS family 4-hydroxybenzoate transporter-like MFS transporter
VIAFGVFTLAVAGVSTLLALGVLRFLAGVGLGGAIPNAAALASEFVPKRHRPFAVTLTIVCVPIGGTLAGLVAARVLPEFGWRMLFVIGGLAPILVGLLLLWLLPESPRYLVRDRDRWPQLQLVLRRMGHELPAAPAFSDPSDPSNSRATIRALLSAGLARDTMALWSAFSFCLLAVYLAFNWVPATLTGTGLDVATASRGLAAFNFGGIAGAMAGSMLTVRLGSRLILALSAAAAVLAALITAAMPIGASAPAAPVIAMHALMGAMINGVQVGLYALATHIYPTALRATGVGAAASVGRLGAIVSTYLGAWVLDVGGPPFFFASIGATMVVAMVSVTLIRNHVPRAS